MTDLEHYLENSIKYIENGGNHKDFFGEPFVEFGKASTGISSDDMWAMAQYAVCTYGRCVKEDTELEMEKKYGYRLDD